MPAEFEEQHPIPQDISSYQFKLVGDMTLKQFLQVAAGALIALTIYASPLHPVIKWPLIILSFLFGIALAFMPIEDRPLGKWIVVFFKSIYSPTIFVWKKTLKPISFFQAEGAVSAAAIPTLKTEVPMKEPEKISGTIFVSEKESAVLTKLEQKEQSFLSKMSHLFALPNLTGKDTTQAPGPGQTLTSQQDVALPEPITVTVVPREVKKKPVVPEKTLDQTAGQIRDLTTKVTPFPSQDRQVVQTPSEVQFAYQASMPSAPTRENIIVGQVVDAKGKILEAAILEIKDEDKRPARALKTNKLGHFMIVTPLLNGKYTIYTEKEGYNFKPVEFSAEGKIIDPISIVAKSVLKEKKPKEENEN